MRKIGFVIPAVVCACASQTQIAADTYLIQTQGRINQESVGSVVSRAIRDAKETCLSNGYVSMQIVDRQTSPGNSVAGRPAEAVLQVKYFKNEGEDRMVCDKI